MNKKIILQAILFLWIVFSLVYIVNNEWQSYKKIQLVNTYNQGKIDTVNAVAEEADKCKPFSVISEAGEVVLIKVACLDMDLETDTE